MAAGDDRPFVDPCIAETDPKTGVVVASLVVHTAWVPLELLAGTWEEGQVEP